MGIAIQNFPEGAVISLPLRSEGQSRLKAFVYGTLSGIVEPIGAVITIVFAGILTPILLYFVVCSRGDALCGCRRTDTRSFGGQSFQYRNTGLWCGIVVMMILDVALG